MLDVGDEEDFSQRRSRLSEFEDRLCEVANFLETRHAFVNAHMVDFFTKLHWERFIETAISNELLALPEEELSCLGTEEYFSLDCVK